LTGINAGARAHGEDAAPMTATALPDEAHRLAVREIGPAEPLRWLALGWRDFSRAPGPGVLHGFALTMFGAALLALAHERFWFLAGAFSGFLLMGPLAATGLYAISRALERGEPATMGTAMRSWIPRDHRLVLFGVLLSGAGTVWVLTSASLITTFASGRVGNPVDFIRHVVLSDRSWLFEAWLALGGAMAAPVYASSVVSIPLLLDRPAGVLSAVLTSWRCVLANPAPMALWGALLMALAGLGLATGFGLVVVVPWLAHASWHAYRALVEPAES
jgi:uncharacterized membrane protein